MATPLGIFSSNCNGNGITPKKYRLPTSAPKLVGLAARIKVNNTKESAILLELHLCHNFDSNDSQIIVVTSADDSLVNPKFTIYFTECHLSQCIYRFGSYSCTKEQFSPGHSAKLDKAQCTKTHIIQDSMYPLCNSVCRK